MANIVPSDTIFFESYFRIDFRLMRSAGAGKYVAELIEDDLNGNDFSVEPYCDPQRFLKP